MQTLLSTWHRSSNFYLVIKLHRALFDFFAQVLRAGFIHLLNKRLFSVLKVKQKMNQEKNQKESQRRNQRRNQKKNLMVWNLPITDPLIKQITTLLVLNYRVGREKRQEIIIFSQWRFVPLLRKERENVYKLVKMRIRSQGTVMGY